MKQGGALPLAKQNQSGEGNRAAKPTGREKVACTLQW